MVFSLGLLSSDLHCETARAAVAAGRDSGPPSRATACGDADRYESSTYARTPWMQANV